MMVYVIYRMQNPISAEPLSAGLREAIDEESRLFIYKNPRCR